MGRTHKLHTERPLAPRDLNSDPSYFDPIGIQTENFVIVNYKR